MEWSPRVYEKDNLKDLLKKETSGPFVKLKKTNNDCSADV